jgi:hypothetical protein
MQEKANEIEDAKVFTDVYKAQSIEILNVHGETVSRFALGKSGVEIINYKEATLQVKIGLKDGKAISFAGMPFEAKMKLERIEVQDDAQDM